MYAIICKDTASEMSGPPLGPRHCWRRNQNISAIFTFGNTCSSWVACTFDSADDQSLSPKREYCIKWLIDYLSTRKYTRLSTPYFDTDRETACWLHGDRNPAARGPEAIVPPTACPREITRAKYPSYGYHAVTDLCCRHFKRHELQIDTMSGTNPMAKWFHIDKMPTAQGL